MKKLVCSAIALSMTSAAGLASESDWSTLDQEVEALTSSLALQNGEGMNMFGRIRTYYVNASDVQEPEFDDDGNIVGFEESDIGGFNVTDARWGVTGARGDYGYKLQVDFADGFVLLDAYADFPIGGAVKGRFGQFKPYISQNALISSGKLAFVDRNVVSALFTGREEGIAITGEFEMIDVALTLQDGEDGDADELLWAVRVAANLMGEGRDMVEGSVGGSEEPTASAGVAFFEDGTLDDGQGILFDIQAGTDVYSFGADVLSTDDEGIGLSNASRGDMVQLPLYDVDSSPFSVFGTYMLQPGTWELGVRFGDFDNELDENKIDVSINNYIDGHNLKWTVQFSTVDSDESERETDAFFVQLQVGF